MFSCQLYRDVGLPPSYTIFGRVVSGTDVVDTIARAPTKPGGENSSPVEPAKIISVDVEEAEVEGTTA